MYNDEVSRFPEALNLTENSLCGLCRCEMRELSETEMVEFDGLGQGGGKKGGKW